MAPQPSGSSVERIVGPDVAIEATERREWLAVWTAVALVSRIRNDSHFGNGLAQLASIVDKRPAQIGLNRPSVVRDRFGLFAPGFLCSAARPSLFKHWSSCCAHAATGLAFETSLRNRLS